MCSGAKSVQELSPIIPASITGRGWAAVDLELEARERVPSRSVRSCVLLVSPGFGLLPFMLEVRRPRSFFKRPAVCSSAAI